jgi:dienelactone hydrolase
MRPVLAAIILAAVVSTADAQSDVQQVASLLSRALQSANVTEWQLRQYAMRRVTPLKPPRSAGEWAAEAQRIRRHLLDEVIFHGWPPEWINSAPKFEDAGAVEGTVGYRARRLRYEIVPGFFSSAVLYEPADLNGRVPAILNVNGHVGPIGKAVEYKQKRCINLAKRGMIALNVEWIGYGELAGKENVHSYAAHLDLAGANGVGLFYLAMRRGLDYLERHPNVDRGRLGVTGLSGGGWQTITLSALDERVAVSVPVAGFSALEAGIEHPEYVGNDIEQNATDFRDGQDYAHLVAMRAPRPTLLIYNAEDDCCFRSGIVRRGVFDDMLPFFRLAGKEGFLRYHENDDPGTHNYQLDNRIQAYRFFSEHFGLPPVDGELNVDREIKSKEELDAVLPNDNLTMLGVAKRIAEFSPQAPGGDREELKRIVRHRPVEVQHAWALASTKSRGVETRSYLFEMSNGLCATGVWLKAIATAVNAPATLVLSDAGKKSAAGEVSDRVNRGEQVLALDLLFFGDSSVPAGRVPEYTQLLSAMGDRPVSMEAGQLLAVASWLKRTSPAPQIRLHTTGMRSQTVALLAAAVDSSAFANIQVEQGIPSLRRLLDIPTPYESAPDLFCLDLYRRFDLPRLKELAAPTRVTQSLAANTATER